MAEVTRLLAEAERIDAAEDELYGKDKRGDELPAELRDRESRLRRIRELKADLEREAREAAEQQAAAVKQKNEAHLRKAKERGKKPGRLAKVPDPEQALPKPRARRNFTDIESRMMKDHATNTFVQGYNAHLGVDAQAQIIVAATVVQAGNDQEQLVPVLLRVKQNLGQLPASVSADAGDFSSAAVTAEEIKTVAVDVPPNAREPQAGNAQYRSQRTPLCNSACGISCRAKKERRFTTNERRSSNRSLPISNMCAAFVNFCCGARPESKRNGC